MLLQPDRVVELCVQPAHAAALAAGRALERQHRLHVEGTKELLTEWVEKEFAPGTPNEQQVMLGKAKAVTKAKFGPYIDALSKVFTARGSSYYYEFRGNNLQADFEEFLRETKTIERLQQRFQTASITGFQGVFLVDLPTEPNPADELPRPYWQYMPSSLIHDAEVRGNVYEYIIFKQTELDQAGEEQTYYVCLDDNTAHVVTPSRAVGGELAYSASRSVAHNLGYVPAFAPSLHSPTALTETTRTSIFDRALPIANDYLDAYNQRILTKHHHAFQKFWSMAVPCNWQGNVSVKTGCAGEAEFVSVSCDAGYYAANGSTHTCPQCKGLGSFIPVGPDKTFYLQPGAAENGIPIPPAGYIRPDVDTWKQQGVDILQLARDLEVAALSKEGITSTNTKQETAMAKLLDAEQVDGRRDDYNDAWLHVKKNVIDTLARYRYSSDFIRSSIINGRKYDSLSLGEQETRYENAKKAGVTDSILFGYLEDLLYTKYPDDPVELEYNRIKLYLDPVPTRSVSEVQAWVKDSPNDEDLQKLFRRKRKLNDYVGRFERENGPLVQFGIRVRFEERIARITEAFDAYDSEAGAAPTANTFPVGARVQVRPGAEHEMGGMVMGGLGTVAEVATPALGIRFDSMPDQEHKWYVADELIPATTLAPTA